MLASRCWQPACWSQESMQTAVEHNEASLAAELLTMLRETVEEVPLSPVFSPQPSTASCASCAWPKGTVQQRCTPTPAAVWPAGWARPQAGRGPVPVPAGLRGAQRQPAPGPGCLASPAGLHPAWQPRSAAHFPARLTERRGSVTASGRRNLVLQIWYFQALGNAQPWRGPIVASSLC